MRCYGADKVVALQIKFKEMLASCHFCTTFRTASLITRLSCNMSDRCSAAWTDTISARPCCKGTTHPASTLSLTASGATTCAGSLTCRACTIASWHNLSLSKLKFFLILPAAKSASAASKTSATAKTASQTSSRKTSAEP